MTIHPTIAAFLAFVFLGLAYLIARDFTKKRKEHKKNPTVHTTRSSNSTIIANNVVGGSISAGGGGSFTINGQTYKGNNIRVVNGCVFVDGVEQQSGLSGVVEIRVVEGSLVNLSTDSSVHCGEVTGDLDAGGSVNCGNVGGDVDAGGSVNCGNVQGDVDAGGSIVMRK